MLYVIGLFALYVVGAVFLQLALRRYPAYRWTLAFALSHTVVLGIVATLVARSLREALVQLLWLPVQFIDFPVSMFRGGTCALLRSVYEDGRTFGTLVCPLVHSGLLGTIQSLVIGRCADRYFRRFGGASVIKETGS